MKLIPSHHTGPRAKYTASESIKQDADAESYYLRITKPLLMPETVLPAQHA